MEIRKDYILDRYVYYAPERRKRRKEFGKVEIIKKGTCFFCPGNENLTPKEIGRVEEKGRWKIRWFPNKFPVVDTKGKAYGYHEIIVETPEHKKQLWDLNREHIKKILSIYRYRVNELEKKKKIKYVLVFKNQGRDAATSLMHAHTQLIAFDRVPKLINEESKANGNCKYCKIIKKEEKSKRLCFKNSSFIAFCPYASRFNYEIWIFPREHIRDIRELNGDGMNDLAEMLRKVLVKLKKLNCSYNFYLHYATKGTNLHFHIEVTPRIAIWGGFELGTDFTINTVLPEEAARFYRS